MDSKHDVPMILTSKSDPDLPLELLENCAYKMDHKRRGIALIINNVLFENGMPERQGSEKDAYCMETTFKKLGFSVIIRHNKSVKHMKELFYDVSVTDHSNNDCFVCVILTHGEDDDIIFGTDHAIPVEDLLKYFLPDRCPSLSGKPKLFFIQACRGTKMDEGKEVHDAILSFYSKSAVKHPKIPIWADVLISYSTVSGYYSWRNCMTGSWFIQSLGHVLTNEATEKELLAMLTKVNYKVANEFESRTEFPKNNRMKQVPCILSMLTKQLYFYNK